MEPKRSNTASRRVLLTGLTLCVILAIKPTSAIEIYTEPYMIVENGTKETIRCTFKSTDVVSSATSVTWSFQSNQPNNKFSESPYVIYYFVNGKGFPGPDEFKDRVKFIGDINKRDVSIELNPILFTDNGTFFCDVKNPPDVMGTQSRTELRIVLKESLPRNNIALIVGPVLGALVVLVLITVAACVTMRMLHNRHNYEGCTSVSVSSQTTQPRKKVESRLQGSRRTSLSGPVQAAQLRKEVESRRQRSRHTRPPGPLQGPVIYAQLDHSGSKNSFHKMEPVVYADIRKN